MPLNSDLFIDSVDSPNLARLCKRLATLAHDLGDAWPRDQLASIGQAGVYAWFVPLELGGLGWSSADLMNGYVQLGAACLTSTFVVTQRVAALRRICGSDNVDLRTRLLPDLIKGQKNATVGISHLTTSRQHVARPVLRAEPVEGGFRVNGFSPWVTGGCGVEYLVMGAQLEDHRQILFAVESQSEGIVIESGFEMVSMTASQTGPVKCNDVFVSSDQVLSGPLENVMVTKTGGSTGGLQTSALAIGLAQAAIGFIRTESEKRPDLRDKLIALEDQHAEIYDQLIQLASGVPVCTNEQLRTESNSIALRSTQAALVAAKGTGFVKGHPVGRWCQEAMFFLVWSCPQAVLDANLCELAGIED